MSTGHGSRPTNSVLTLHTHPNNRTFGLALGVQTSLNTEIFCVTPRIALTALSFSRHNMATPHNTVYMVRRSTRRCSSLATRSELAWSDSRAGTLIVGLAHRRTRALINVVAGRPCRLGGTAPAYRWGRVASAPSAAARGPTPPRSWCCKRRVESSRRQRSQRARGA